MVGDGRRWTPEDLEREPYAPEGIEPVRGFLVAADGSLTEVAWTETMTESDLTNDP